MEQHALIAANEIADQQQNDGPDGAAQEGIDEKQGYFHFRNTRRESDHVADAGEQACGEHGNRAVLLKIILHHAEFVWWEEEIFAIAPHETHTELLGEPIGKIRTAHRSQNAA